MWHLSVVPKCFIFAPQILHLTIAPVLMFSNFCRIRIRGRLLFDGGLTAMESLFAAGGEFFGVLLTLENFSATTMSESVSQLASLSMFSYSTRAPLSYSSIRLLPFDLESLEPTFAKIAQVIIAQCPNKSHIFNNSLMPVPVWFGLFDLPIYNEFKFYKQIKLWAN